MIIIKKFRAIGMDINSGDENLLCDNARKYQYFQFMSCSSKFLQQMYASLWTYRYDETSV